MTQPWIHEHPACLAEGLAPRVGDHLRVLHVDGTEVWAGRGLTLLHSADGGASFQERGRVPGRLAQRLLSRNELTTRLFRTGFHAVAPLPGGALVAVVRGAVLHLRADAQEFELAHSIQRGKRPLNLCVHPSGRVYFGEYFRNRFRRAVHLYGSDDGRSFHVVGTFKRRSIRHVHAIHWDPHRAGMWVLTGDDGDEAGLWFTPDEFVTLEPVLRGAQAARAVTLFAREDGLILPTDTPFERNYVQHFDPETGTVERLAELPGSVFHGTRSRSLYLLSTVVERSPINTDPRPALFASRDGDDWKLVARLRRDFPQLEALPPFLQWPTLLLPTGSTSTDTIWASGQALARAHDRALTWSDEALASELFDKAERHSA